MVKILLFDCFWQLVQCWYTVGTVLVELWRLVHQWSFLLFWLSFDCFDCFWQNSKHDHWCTNRHRSTKTVPTVYQSSKTVKQQKWPLVYQSINVWWWCLHRVRRIHKVHVRRPRPHPRLRPPSALRRPRPRTPSASASAVRVCRIHKATVNWTTFWSFLRHPSLI